MLIIIYRYIIIPNFTTKYLCF